MPFRTGQETRRVSPPGHEPRSYKDRPCKRNAGQRPQGTDAGRGLWPRRVLIRVWRNGRGDGPCIEAVEVPSPLRAGTGNAARFPRPRGTLPHRPAGPGTPQASARPGGREAPAEGGAGAGRGLWPPAGQGSAWCCAGAMAPAREAGAVLSPLRAGETRPAFPLPARNGALQTGRSGTNERPAPGPAGAKRPPGAARTLAGGFGPRLVRDQRGTVAGVMAPATAAGAVLSSVRAGSGNAARFPRPRGTLPRSLAGPGGTQASARRGRGGRWPGALAPRLDKGQRGAVAGAMAPARPREARAGGRVSCFPARSPCGRHVFSNLSAAAGRA